jgi:hypothetical protein
MAHRFPFPPPNDETGAARRWLYKTVYDSRVLDDMEASGPWSRHGQGAMAYTNERSTTGRRSLRLSFPSVPDHTVTGDSGAVTKDSFVRFHLDGEDLSAFNRISLWVFPIHKGFPAPTMFMFLRNDGRVAVPDRYRREGVHYLVLKPEEWNHVVWEIANLARDRVTAIDIGYHLRGRMPGWARSGTLDLDRLELQVVDADHYEGWNVAPRGVAFSHVGYSTGSVKTAVVDGTEGGSFSVVETAGGTEVLSRDVKSVETPLGGFEVLDFSEVQDPGEYELHFRGQLSGTFEIGPHVWIRPMWPLLSFLYHERCGTSVEGIHAPCHGDLVCRHGDYSIVADGGWHDAGDLSQMTMHTAPIVAALFSAADVVAQTEPDLSEKLVEEAMWGLEYIVKTRFGDGYRVSTRPTGEWSDGIIGTEDDKVYEARNMPYDNLVSSIAEVSAWRALCDQDPHLSRHYLGIAREDFEFALAGIEEVGAADVDIAGGAGLSAIELHSATGERRYLEHAARFAAVITESQERGVPDWDIPLTGFLYKNPEKQQVMRYNPRSQMHLLFMTLSRLCRAAPNHPHWMRWYSCAVRYVEYLKRVAEFCEPFGMIPHSIYALDETHSPGLFSSQADLHKYAHIEAEDPQYVSQVRNGIRLSERHYLRRFPVWYGHRGNHSIILSEAKALSEVGLLRHDQESLELAERQLHWVFGLNPFCRSTVYGVGYDYSPLYSPTSGPMIGAMPVGIRTRGNRDEPYWPAAISYNFKEVWVEPLSRFFWIARDLVAAQEISGEGGIAATGHGDTGDGRVRLHAVRRADGGVRITASGVFAEARFRLDNLVPKDAAAGGVGEREADFPGTPSGEIRVRGAAVRPDRTLRGESGEHSESRTVRATLDVEPADPRSPWIAVVFADGDFHRRAEVSSYGLR